MARLFHPDRINRTVRSRLAVVGIAVAALAVVGVLVTSGLGGDDALDSPSIGGAQSQGGGFGLSFPGSGALEESRAESGGVGAGADGDAVAPNASSPPGVPGDEGSLAFQITGRDIIRTAAMSLEVEAVSTAFEQVQQIATAAGGYVSDSSFSGSDDRQAARLTVRVPSEHFTDVMRQFRDLAVEVRDVSTGTQDVSEEVADIEATLRNLRAVESQYVELLSRANSIGDVLQVQDRLNQTRLQIDRVEGRRATLANLTELSTIQVALYPQSEAVAKTEPATGPLAAAANAWEASLEVLEAIATGVLVAIVFSWWMIPLALIALIVWRATRRRPVEIDTPQGSA